ncbi:MAG: FGGY-family carbohydrate kinase [Candidatus Nanopelagicales bacterium]
MTAYLLAIDGGSQSTKVSVLDSGGTVHASAQEVLRPYELGPDGRAVHPDDDLWDSLTTTCRSALAAFSGDPDQIVGIGLCGIRFCRALMDARGRLTEPVLSWMDARVSVPLAQVDPAVATVASAAGYLTLRLTGSRRDSAANYQGMWPIDPAARGWSTDPGAVQRTGMPLALLPDLVDPGGLLGHITEEAAAATGLRAGWPVYATANDKAVEALGCGLSDDRTLLLSLGTYIAAMTLGADVDGHDDRYWVNSAAIPGRYLYESGGIRRGMWTVSWLRALVSAALPGPIDQDAILAWLNEGAQAVPPGCGGLLTIPDWLAPGDAPYRRGAILGLDGSHGPHHLYRSILEGIALTMRGHAEAMEAALGWRPERLVVSGGGARSDLMMQIVADVVGRPAERSGIADAAGLGAAMCAAVGAGVHPDFETAMAMMTRPGQVFGPEPRAQRRYDVVMDAYQALPSFTDPMFQHMSAALNSPDNSPAPPW